MYSSTVGKFEFPQLDCADVMGFFLNGEEFAEFTEFSEFRESIETWNRIILTVFSVVLSLWLSGRVSVSHTGGHGFEPSNLFKIILFLSLNSVKTFRKNSNGLSLLCPKCVLGHVLSGSFVPFVLTHYSWGYSLRYACYLHEKSQNHT